MRLQGAHDPNGDTEEGVTGKQHYKVEGREGFGPSTVALTVAPEVA